MIFIKKYLAILPILLMMNGGFASEFGEKYDDTKNQNTYDMGYQQMNIPGKIIKGKTVLKNSKYKNKYNLKKCNNNEDCEHFDKKYFLNDEEDCKEIIPGLNKISLDNDKEQFKYRNGKNCNAPEECGDMYDIKETPSIDVDPFINSTPSTKIHGKGNPNKQIYNYKNIDLRKGYQQASDNFSNKEKLDTQKDLDNIFGEEVSEQAYNPNKQKLKEKYVEPSNTIGMQDFGDIKVDNVFDVPEVSEQEYNPNKQKLKEKYVEPSNTIGNQDVDVDDLFGPDVDAND